MTFSSETSCLITRMGDGGLASEEAP